MAPKTRRKIQPKATQVAAATDQDSGVLTPYKDQNTPGTSGTSTGTSGTSTGHGSQGVYPRERPPPTHNDTEKTWPKYSEEFRLHLLDQNEEDDIFNSKFSIKRNREIYSMLIRGVGNKAFNLISKSFKDKGQEAFKFLEEYYLGSVSQRRQHVLEDLFQQEKLEDSDSIPDYVSKITNCNEDCKEHGFLPADTSEEEPSLLTAWAMSNLPPKHDDLSKYFRMRPEGLPGLKEFKKLLLNENHILNRMQAKSKNQVSAVSTNNVGKSRPAKRPRNDFGANGGGGGGHMVTSRPHNNNKPPVTCTKCLSRNGSHNEKDCRSQKWCYVCKNASHDKKDCRANFRK